MNRHVIDNPRKRYRTQVWHPFDMSRYRWEWHEKKLVGVICEFGRDLRRCHDRIWKGYCDFDTFSISDWFLDLMPTMLQEFKDHQHGYPVMTDDSDELLYTDEQEEEAQQAWNEILDRMIFLLREADDKTCSKKNPYEAEFDRAAEEFTRKYGVMGERLEIGEKRGGTASSPGSRVYTLLDVEAYRPIAKRYMEEERKRLYSKVSGNPIIMV